MRAVLNGLVVNLFTFCDFRIYYRVVVISDMATRNTSYVGASATPKDAEASESVAKDTHSVSKRFFSVTLITKSDICGVNARDPYPPNAGPKLRVNYNYR